MKFKLLVTTALCSIGFFATTSIFADQTLSMGSQIKVINTPSSNITLTLHYEVTYTPAGHYNNGFGSVPYAIGGAPTSFNASTETPSVYYSDTMSSQNSSQSTANMYVVDPRTNNILCKVHYTIGESLSGLVMYQRGYIYANNVGAFCYVNGDGECRASGVNNKSSCKTTDNWGGNTITVDMSSYGVTNTKK